MKRIIKHIVRAGAVCGLLLSVATASAQKVQIKIMEWNVLSFEMTDKTNQTHFYVDEYVALIKEQNPDILCLNELESGTSRMGKEKLMELASRLDMYPYYVMSYPKDVGFYGNGILSKYPIVGSGSMLLPYKHYLGDGNYQFNNEAMTTLWGADQRSVGYADILVPTSDSEGQMIRVACTHLDHQINQAGKTIQSQKTADYLKLSNPVYPTILTGDLNEGADSTSLKPITDLGDLIQATWVDFIISYPKGRWTKVSGGNVNCGELSDHDPNVAVVTLN